MIRQQNPSISQFEDVFDNDRSVFEFQRLILIRSSLRQINIGHVASLAPSHLRNGFSKVTKLARNYLLKFLWILRPSQRFWIMLQLNTNTSLVPIIRYHRSMP